MLRASVSRGIAPVNCPVCAASAPRNDEVEGLATVGGSESERGSRPILERFECGTHTEADLTYEQEAAIIESAIEYLADARQALEDAHWDQRIDSYRDEGGF